MSKYCSFLMKKIMQSHKNILLSLIKEAEINEKQIGFIQGPLPLKQSTKDIEYVVKSLLDPSITVVFSHDQNKELIVTIGSQPINLTQALADDPDLDHIHLSQNEYDQYILYVTNHSEFKPSSLNPNHYKQDEKDHQIDSTLLHFAEKIAINVYTGPSYKIINPFFRNNGKQQPTDTSLSNSKMQTRIKDILLVAVIATLGLNRLPLKDTIKLFRIDKQLPDECIEKRIKCHTDTDLFHEKSFFSTSEFQLQSDFNDSGNAYSLIINDNAKSIRAYSCLKMEEEFLFSPGKNLAVLSHKKENNTHYFLLKSTRALGLKKSIPTEDNQSNFLNYGLFTNKKILFFAAISVGVVSAVLFSNKHSFHKS